MTTERGLDRLIFFTDAVAAIAITLLILPLVDLVPDAARSGITAAEFVALVLAVTFAVVGLWSLFVLFLAGPAAAVIGRRPANHDGSVVHPTP
jgi:uncharacterized membrane protein